MSNIIELRRRTHGLYGTLRYCGTGPFPAPRECQWIAGQPGEPVCGKATVRGSAWCEEHHGRAFMKQAPVGLAAE
jgi:hypothetical protein